MIIQQGDVFHVDLPRGGGEHMAVVISANQFNAANHSIMIVPFTSDEDGKRSGFESTAMFQSGDYSFLTKQSAAPAEWMEWVDRKSLDSKLGNLKANDLNRVLNAIAHFFDIPTYMDTDD